LGWSVSQRGPRITPRDVEILEWIGRHGIVTQAQVATRFFDRGSGSVGLWASYRRLRKLGHLGLVQRDPTHWNEPHVLRLTTSGARVADVGLHPAKLVHAEVRHSLALVDLLERLLAAHPAASLTTERELRAERHRQRHAGNAQILGRIPDGVLRWPNGFAVAIELDLTTKRERDSVDIMDRYVASPFARVWWFVPSARAVRLRRIVSEQNAGDLIEVWEWPIP
jgi:Replication-relaxation